MCQYRKVQDTCRRLSLFNLFNLNASFRAVLKPEDPTPKLSFPIAWIYSCFHIWQFNIRMLDSKSNKLLLPEKKIVVVIMGFVYIEVIPWDHSQPLLNLSKHATYEYHCLKCYLTKILIYTTLFISQRSETNFIYSLLFISQFILQRSSRR